MPENYQIRTIGVVLPTLDSYFITSALKGIGEIAGASGYELIVTHSRESLEKESANARWLLESGVDGVIASLVMQMKIPAHFSNIANTGIPVVFFDRVPENGDYQRVMIDNAGCGYTATEHLIREGCRRIAFITYDRERNVYGQRYSGYRGALKKYAVPFPGELLVLEDDEQAGSRMVEAAATCMQALTEAGIRVPEDIAIVGFNNDPIGRLVTPTLTTINYPGYEMGKAAAARLLADLVGRLKFLN